MAKVRITLERQPYDGWAGSVPGRTVVKEFEDASRAADWFIHDSYFQESYTTRATWELLDE